MEQASRQIQSSQLGVHPRLGQVVARHRQARWQKPPQTVDQAALDTLDAALAQHEGPLVLDSFCGTGMSTAQLAKAHPDALVVGVDKSAHRLARAPESGENYLLLQAHCEAVWRHLHERGQRLSHHYLLYPNPWPKPGHLARRVHGHPAFPLLVELGGHVELRSNWQVYGEEFGVALHLMGVPARISIVEPTAPALTLFEAKYRRSGHDLWCLRARLDDALGPLTPGAEAPATRDNA